MNTYLARFSVPVEQQQHWERMKALAERVISTPFDTHSELKAWIEKDLGIENFYDVKLTSTGATVGLLSFRINLLTFVILT